MEALTSPLEQLELTQYFEWVNGGIVPIVAAYYAIGIVGTLYVGAYAGLASMRLGYAANHK